jgi:hypothetical protein
VKGGGGGNDLDRIYLGVEKYIIYYNDDDDYDNYS